MRILSSILVVLLFVAGFILGGLMFEYSLYSITGKDVNFMIDVLGGFIFNGALFAVWFLCFVARAIGIEAPFFDV